MEFLLLIMVLGIRQRSLPISSYSLNYSKENNGAIPVFFTPFTFNNSVVCSFVFRNPEILYYFFSLDAGINLSNNSMLCLKMPLINVYVQLENIATMHVLAYTLVLCVNVLPIKSIIWNNWDSCVKLYDK